MFQFRAFAVVAAVACAIVGLNLTAMAGLAGGPEFRCGCESPPPPQVADTPIVGPLPRGCGIDDTPSIMPMRVRWLREQGVPCHGGTCIQDDGPPPATKRQGLLARLRLPAGATPSVPRAEHRVLFPRLRNLLSGHTLRRN